MKQRDVEVRPIRSDEEMRKLYEIEVEEYGTKSIVGLDILNSWWARFPDTAFCLTKNDEIVGGMLIWPLHESAFTLLVSGQLDETQMLETHVTRKEQDATFRYWYIGDIILKKGCRSGRARWSAQLLAGSLNQWLDGENVSSQLKIGALVYSEQGRLLAEKLNFLHTASSPQGYAVFQRETGREDFRRDVREWSERFGVAAE
jgi:hypothetical protein